MKSPNWKWMVGALVAVMLFAVFTAGYIMNRPGAARVEVTPTAHFLTAYDFSFLRAGMRYHEIVTQVGLPDGDVGSGLHAYTWQLQGRKVMILAFGSDQTILTATLFDQDTQASETIPLLDP